MKLLLIVLVLLMSLPVFAQYQPSGQTIIVVIDDQEQNYVDTPPLMMHSRVLVPMRPIFESLGASLNWDNMTKTVTATRGTEQINLTIGNSQATIRENQAIKKRVTLDALPVLSQGTTYVPLRFVSESLGARVNWESDARRVVIMTGAAMSNHPMPNPNPMPPMAGMTQEVKVALTEMEIILEPAIVAAGDIRFIVVNTGAMPHALAIVGVTSKTANLAQGEKATLLVHLMPGTYTLYCPIGKHRVLGMEKKLTVN